MFNFQIPVKVDLVDLMQNAVFLIMLLSAIVQNMDYTLVTHMNYQMAVFKVLISSQLPNHRLFDGVLNIM